MKESVGYTVTLNIVITFIVIVFAFLSGVLMYYKSYKVSNIVTNSLEKYEGFNNLSSIEISTKLESLGYNSVSIKCKSSITDNAASGACNLQSGSPNGTCIYLCTDKKDSNYYYYKSSTNMFINIPIVNEILNIPVYSTTNRMCNFG